MIFSCKRTRIAWIIVKSTQSVFLFMKLVVSTFLYPTFSLLID